jgi:putative polyketide hydroxylase
VAPSRNASWRSEYASIAAAAPPGRRATTIVIAQSVAGPVYRQISEEMPDFAAFSPAPVGIAGQERAEAILADRARALGAELRFETQLESLTQDPDGVTAILTDLRTGARHDQRAAYLVGADGHRGAVRDHIGVRRHGRGHLGETTSLVFEADIEPGPDGAAVQMWYLQNPALPGGSGVFVSTDTPGRYVVGVHTGEAVSHARAAAASGEWVRAAGRSRKTSRAGSPGRSWWTRSARWTWRAAP